jgi:hypothetical protein
MTYGGNEEIVLKDQKELENLKKQEKTEKLQSQRMYMHNVHQVFFWNTDSYREARMGMLQLMLDKENIIFTKVKRNILVRSYTRSGKDSQRRSVSFNKVMEIMVVSGWSDDGADITNEVKNIQQMILVCMIWRVTLLNGLRMYIDIIDNEANDFNYFRGNKYSKNKIGSDGKVEIVTETMKETLLVMVKSLFVVSQAKLRKYQ